MKQIWRFLLVLLLLLSVFYLNCYSVNAVEINGDFYYPLGLTEEEAEEFLVDGSHYVVPLPDVSFYDFSSNLDYTIEEEIRLSDGIYYEGSSSAGDYSGSTAFGSVVGYGYASGFCELTLEYDNLPLFTKGGTLNLKIYVEKGNYLSITYTYASGDFVNVIAPGSSNDSASNPPYSHALDDTTFEFEVPNENADLVRVEVRNLAGSHGCYVGLMKYGYILTTSSEDDTSKNIFELLQDFIGGFWDNIKNAFQNAISGLFVPDEEYLQTKTEALKNQVYDSLGLLIYPVAFLQDLFDSLLQADKTQAVFVLPEIQWEGQTVIPETSFDMYSFFYDNGFGFLIDVCSFATSVVLVGAFLVFCQDTLRRILDDN